MKLFLTSGGISNPSIKKALEEMLGKPTTDSDALAIPTASYGHRNVSPQQAWKFLAAQEPRAPMLEVGWKTVGTLELTALPSIGDDRWVSWVRDADVLLVNGGDPLYLSYWIKESGLAELFPSLPDTVWVGLSAGSMVMTPRIGEDFVGWRPPTGGDETLGLVDFAIFPHLDHPMLPENTMADAERWAATIGMPAYAMDDSTAIKVVDGSVEVISEGNWKLFNE